ncbi:hypothetical protein GCM10009000_085230 [Halobacterium noricense]|uniref:Uncharacterized protein n=1 Tax=Haladaptatus pallidirubidus TaxID=1008152 RepID=A0AAV3URA8_9EURY
MKPARFVTLSFVYSGIVLLAQYAFLFESPIAVITQLGAGLSILGTGLLRLYKPEEYEQKPTNYGLLAYGMAILALVLTALFFVQIFMF